MTVCKTSDPGFYAQNSGSSEQTPCLAGTYQPEFGGTECYESQSGSYVASDGLATPSSCPPGSYQPSAGQSSCIDASPGSFASMSSSTEQVSCPPGTWQDQPGQSTGSQRRRALRSSAVHPRPPPDRRHRSECLEPRIRHLRVPTWSGVQQRVAGRRNQPGIAEDPIRPP